MDTENQSPSLEQISELPLEERAAAFTALLPSSAAARVARIGREVVGCIGGFRWWGTGTG
jgi:hypothetical protein